MTLKIDKSVPSPNSLYAPDMDYPFAEMEVGDSFFVPAEMCETGQLLRQRHALLAGQRLGLGIQTAREDDGVRVWRVK